MQRAPSAIWMRLLPDRLVVGLCTLGPVGFWGKAPGTNGTVAGIALYTLLFINLPLWGQVLLAVGLVYLSVLLCGEGELRMQKRDPGSMILDEIAAVPLCFIGLQWAMVATGHIWAYMLGGFVLFRFFDILKPLGINSLQKMPGGLGVVMDDVAAALATNICLQLIAFGVLQLR